MKKYYVIQCLSHPQEGLYLRAMGEGYTEFIKSAGKWPTEESAVDWINNLSRDRYYGVIPVYMVPNN